MVQSFDLICAVLFLSGAMLQSVIGFGMGVLTIPVFVWLGVPLQDALALVLPGVFFQTLLNSIQNKEELAWRPVIIAIVPRYIGLACGIWILRHWLSDSKEWTGIVLGSGIWMILALQLMKPLKEPLSLGQLVPIGWISGFSAGVIGMGGPALVFWTASQKWNVRFQRSFLWLSFLTFVPVQAAMLIHQFGHSIVEELIRGCWMIPATLTGALIGNRIGNRLSERWLRNLMYGFLALIACRLMISGLMSMMSQSNS